MLLNSRDGTPVAPGAAAWGSPEAPRPSFWEPSHPPQSRPLGGNPAAGSRQPAGESSDAQGGNKEAAAACGQQEQQRERPSWAAGYFKPADNPAAASISRDVSSCLDAANPKDDATGIFASQLKQDQGEELGVVDAAQAASSQQRRPAFRERTDSAVYHRDNPQERPRAPAAAQQPAQRALLGSRNLGTADGIAPVDEVPHVESVNKAGLAPVRSWRECEEEADAQERVLQASLGRSEVQLCRHSRALWDSQAQQPSASQVRFPSSLSICRLTAAPLRAAFIPHVST